MAIKRIENASRLSQVVIHDNTIYLAGQVDTSTDDVAGQTRGILASIDRLLLSAGSDKSKILQVNIWLTDISTFGEMNQEWDKWVAPNCSPARTTGQVRLTAPEYKVEITVIAAK